MTTPSAAFPYSPTPPSPSPTGAFPTPYDHAAALQQQQQEEWRRSTSKRDSVQRREEEALRYPSPPPGGAGLGVSTTSTSSSSRSRPNSLEASLVIPPFNPNKIRTPTAPAVNSNSVSAADISAGAPRISNQILPTTQQQQHLHQQQQYLLQQQQQQQYHFQQQQNSYPNPASNRPASAAVIPAPHHSNYSTHATGGKTPVHVGGGGSTTSNSRVRQSVGYLPATSQQSTSAGPYPHLYTPHPMPRQKIYFGPYILLQTLGEGEFGKVKLGVHSERWGEEVAIKLIKRGNVDTAQRTEKVRREIEVLKAVRHPNIVRLYDVIETEKYIGIVLEYASGGELFDHILAHRYLKERDAARLFAQLISGVAYLHSKKIVHRDLKLENLLLDRNRNVIITDFGFANRFELAADDLMSTSCGSPCYAAPELVVQEGKYVGTAVDVWSCGVILYAMLAGYLPYDDDPANPEGDNINLLYKYIINTPLTFPDWITNEPRDLLLRMLVPDPINRCTIEDVMRHSFLRKYTPMFEKTVSELEMQAQEAEMFKRQALEAQRQFLIQQQLQLQQQQASGLSAVQAQAMARSQTSAAISAGKHRSAVVQGSIAGRHHMMETSNLPSVVQEESPAGRLPASASSSAGFALPYQNPNRRPNAPPTTQAHPISVDADPFSYDSRSGAQVSPTPLPTPHSVPMIPSFSAPPSVPAVAEDQIMTDGEQVRPQQQEVPIVAAPSPPAGRSRRSSTKHSTPSSSAPSSDAERRKKAHRATVQVEYDGGETSRTPKYRSRPSAPASPEVPLSPVSVSEDVVMTPVDQSSAFSPPPIDDADLPVAASLAAMALSSPGSPVPQALEPLAVRPPTPPLVPIPFPSTPPRTPASPSATSTNTPKKRKNAGSPVVTKTSPSDAQPSAPPVPMDQDATPKAKKMSTSSAVAPAITVAEPNSQPASQTPSSIEEAAPRPPSSASTISMTKHKKGALSTDRFSLRGLLGSSTTSLERTSSAKEKTAALAAERAAEAQRIAEQQAALDEVTNNRRKSRRQKALSMGGFSRPHATSKASKAAAAAAKAAADSVSTSTSTTGGSSSSRSRTLSTVQQGSTSMAPPPPRPSTSQASVASSSRPISTRSSTTRSDADSVGGTPSTKAKAVMDWFRRKGPKGETAVAVPFATDFDRNRPSSLKVEPASSSTASLKREGSVTPVGATTPARIPSASPVVQAPVHAQKPAVVVTDSNEESFAQSVPSSRSASGAQSNFSQTTTTTAATTASTASVAPVAAAVTPTPAFSDSKLRLHTGALDKTALTSRPPPAIMVEIRTALWSMGIDMIQEGEFKLKCTRKSRKKAQAAASTGLGVTPSSPAPPSPGSSALRTSVSGSPSLSTLTASPSSGFRSFFGRKGAVPSPIDSPSLNSSPGMPSPALSSHEGFDLLSSPLATPSAQFLPASPQPQPSYGDSNDGGGEVRFYCEITRVSGLTGMYAVDLKRVKGELFSYRHCYTTLMASLQL
ncbi:Pkinase-domain-containing protein [Meredithblackwellia eburnea MCA 4105]